MDKFNLKKELNRQAKQVLPDSSFKDNLVKEVEAPMQEKQRVKEKWAMPKRMVYGLVSLCLIVCVSLGVGLGLGLDNGPNDSIIGDGGEVLLEPAYVSIDINPSFGITVDEEGNVKEIDALNEDAAVVLVGVELEGKPYVEVYAYIIENCVKLGYLSQDGEVSVVICGDKDNFVASLTERAENSINEVLTSINATINTVFGEENIRQAIEEAGKYIEQVEEMTAKELNEYLKEFDREAIEQYLTTLTAQYEQFLADVEVLAEKIEKAHQEHDWVNLTQALLEAYDYIVLFLEMRGEEFVNSEFVSNLMMNPDYFEAFDQFFENILSGEDKEVNETIGEYIRSQLKESKEEQK